MEYIATRLSDLAVDLEEVETADTRARALLQGLRFIQSMLQAPCRQLSGGWRMRLALAQALFASNEELLLLDEVSNHMDLQALDFLQTYLQAQTNVTMVIVSHDRTFLDAVCTDVCVMEHRRLTWYAGDYSAYLQTMRDKAARESQILDAAQRQTDKATAFIRKHQHSYKADPNKQRQAKTIRDKKLDRIGNYREDGKRYKQFSLAKLSEKSLWLAQKVTIEEDEPVPDLKFPSPVWPPSLARGDALIRMEDMAFGYTNDATILENVTANIARGSKIALVGPNGCGKSSLVQLLAGGHEPRRTQQVWKHPNIRIGHVSQFSEEAFQEYAHMTVLEFAERQLKTGRVSGTVMQKASGNVRQYLGAFGLGDTRHVSQTISSLSGGERMRLCFATVMADGPHLLLMDESTNHVDIESLDKMAAALRDFDGAILMVSHNQSFLSGFCNELWILRKGRLDIRHTGSDHFDECFSNYRASVANGKSELVDRKERADKAQKARTLRQGHQRHVALM